MVNEWFVSLKAERVHIEFSEIREVIGTEIATAHAIAQFTAPSILKRGKPNCGGVETSTRSAKASHGCKKICWCYPNGIGRVGHVRGPEVRDRLRAGLGTTANECAARWRLQAASLM